MDSSEPLKGSAVRFNTATSGQRLAIDFIGDSSVYCRIMKSILQLPVNQGATTGAKLQPQSELGHQSLTIDFLNEHLILEPGMPFGVCNPV